MVGGDGVEPPEPEATDLQSALLPLTVYPPRYLLRCPWAYSGRKSRRDRFTSSK